LGARHPVVRWAEWYEGVAGRLADAHLCVSSAMKEDLRRRFGLTARLLRDLPWERLKPARRSSGRPIVVCPAGWTADEDMELLLDAIEQVPPDTAEFHLTGDGPRRPALEPRIEKLKQAGFRIHTGFLPELVYWNLIQSASAGVSLHRSSSGLDLAMKVVDLHAAQVAVAAFDYGPVLAEQVPAGLRFRSAEELARLLRAVEKWPAPGETPVWSEEWRSVAAPLFE
jgi:beta-1,4-mannosyltransferase